MFIIANYILILNNETIRIGDVKGMEALVSLASNVPVIGTKTSTYLVETFINEVIDYHNSLENELPTKHVVFYFYETGDTTVVRKTVDLLEQKEKEVNTQLQSCEVNGVH